MSPPCEIRDSTYRQASCMCLCFPNSFEKRQGVSLIQNPGRVENMHLPRLSISVASVLLGIIGCSNLVYADCSTYTGKGVTNALTTDPFSAPASLGTVTLKKKKGTSSVTQLECGVRGIPYAPQPGDDGRLHTKFLSIIVCGGGAAHSEFFADTEATLTLGICGPGDYDPTNPYTFDGENYVNVNGAFEELGSIYGTWGELSGQYGSISISGTSQCGLQEWDVEAEICD